MMHAPQTPAAANAKPLVKMPSQAAQNQRAQSFSTQERKELTEQIKAMTYNKGVGMTEDQWKLIVEQNAYSDKLDSIRKKNETVSKRMKLKEELNKQVAMKEEQRMQNKANELRLWENNNEVIAQSRSIEQRRQQQRTAKFKQDPIDFVAQVLVKENNRVAVGKVAKEAEVAQRRELELKIAAEKEQEARVKEEKRLKLMQMTLEDRKAKASARVANVHPGLNEDIDYMGKYFA